MFSLMKIICKLSSFLYSHSVFSRQLKKHISTNRSSFGEFFHNSKCVPSLHTVVIIILFYSWHICIYIYVSFYFLTQIALPTISGPGIKNEPRYDPYRLTLWHCNNRCPRYINFYNISTLIHIN